MFTGKMSSALPSTKGQFESETLNVSLGHLFRVTGADKSQKSA